MSRIGSLYRILVQRPWRQPQGQNSTPVKLNNRPHRFAISISDPRVHNITNGHAHAIDYPLYIGTQIVAVDEGEIIEFVDHFPDKDPRELSDDGNLNYLKIRDTKTGKIQFYAHLKQGSVTELYLKVGDQIKARQPIAKSGHNGQSTMPHLHFGMYEENDSAPNGFGMTTVPCIFQHW